MGTVPALVSVYVVERLPKEEACVKLSRRYDCIRAADPADPKDSRIAEEHKRAIIIKDSLFIFLVSLLGSPKFLGFVPAKAIPWLSLDDAPYHLVRLYYLVQHFGTSFFITFPTFFAPRDVSLVEYLWIQT